MEYILTWEYVHNMTCCGKALTGREHLLFYGRLKNLKGSVLTQAVEESWKSLNLFHGGVVDKQAGKYSGGMKRRLSVAISLIGDPKLKARYGGTYVLTMTASSDRKKNVENMVQ
ncbi:ABC transporter A family member 3-like isoform X1 [Cicer arietinum]|uniref:ABC transporter A family member 3-like isoform X1 n=1 Tax=Cicer arietinum TaxID=3827 RepID=UPI003CC66923